MSLLEGIHSPADLKALSRSQLDQLAAEIRHVIIQTVARRAGHLAPNLGVVELTLARLGKRAGTDAARAKATYPRAVGEAQARDEADRLLESAAHGASRLGPRARHLGQLILAVAERDR